MNLIKIMQLQHITLVIYSNSDNYYEYSALDPLTGNIFNPKMIFSSPDLAEELGCNFVALYIAVS